MKGKRTLRGTFKLDPSKTPKHIDLNFTGENGAVVPSKAIYKIEGNTLTLCEADFGQETHHGRENLIGQSQSLTLATAKKPFPNGARKPRAHRQSPIPA